MSPLAWIVASSVAGAVLSVGAAGVLALTANPRWIPVLISYAIGALLGAAFLEVLPHALEGQGNPQETALTILVGILLFFILEKLVLWRHCHDEGCQGHDAAGGHGNARAASMILIGDGFHNFVDGVLIGAAFLESTALGLVTALAIIAHEIPQEMGDFVILLHSGFSRAKAFAFNLVSSGATLLGGVSAYFALSQMMTAIPTLLGLAAASMIYVAVADLIPGLHRRTALSETVQQVSLICAGVASVWLAQGVVHGFVG